MYHTERLFVNDHSTRLVAHRLSGVNPDIMKFLECVVTRGLRHSELSFDLEPINIVMSESGTLKFVFATATASFAALNHSR